MIRKSNLVPRAFPLKNGPPIFYGKSPGDKVVERVPERALRAVYNDRNATYDELLEKGRLSILENRQLQDKLILMYKVKNSLAPEHVCNMFFSAR